jgi:hypothetical protein
MIVARRSANSSASTTSLLRPNRYFRPVHSVPSYQATAAPTLPRSSRDPSVQMHLISSSSVDNAVCSAFGRDSIKTGTAIRSVEVGMNVVSTTSCPEHCSGVYLKRIKKRSHDGCWFCEPSHNPQDTPRMTRTHVLLRCVAFEEFRRETWTDPLTGEFTRPSSIGQLLGNPRWEKRLLKFLQRTKIGRIGPDLIDDEVRRVTRYEGWTDLVPDERSIDRGEQVADHILDTIVVRQT